MQITKAEENILVSELIKSLSRPELDPIHEITVKMLTDLSGKSKGICREILKYKVANEGWLKHEVLNNTGHPLTAYYNPKTWTPEVNK